MKRPFVVLVLAPLVLLFLGIAGYFTWGALQKRRFHERLEALRAEGVPTRFEDLVEPVVPDEDNGADLLAEAESIREAVEDASMEDIGWLQIWEIEDWEEEGTEVDEEDRALAAEMLQDGSASAEPLLPRWGALLERSEADLPQAVRLVRRQGFVLRVWMIEERLLYWSLPVR